MPKTILILAANPKNTSRLRLDQEVREIDNGLQRARRRDEFILEQKWAVRPVDVRRAMLDLRPNIIHFCGHGGEEEEEGIAFEDETGQAKLVNADTLAEFFELFADKIECVILNACYSEVQAGAVAQHIPHVIGMKNAIGDTAAIAFSVAFYDALGAGESIEFAYKLACNAIRMEGNPEHLTPILKFKAHSTNREEYNHSGEEQAEIKKTLETYETKESDEPKIPIVLSQEYLRIRNEEGIVPSKIFYFEHLMPLIRPWLEQRKEHQQLRERKYSTLVSLMGFSPETTVHSTVILRPKKLIIVYNEAVQASAKPAIDYLLGEEIISHFDLEMLEIDPYNPVNIYDNIFAKIPTSENMVFDITGGTKVMSATAGALAWEKNLSLCYLEGGWDPQKGASGLRKASKLFMFPNPSRSRGFRFRKDALRSYERGNFLSAAERFSESVQLIDDSHFDLLGIQLCDCYSALVDFDREGMLEKVNKLEETLKFGGVRKLYQNRIDFEPHLEALRKFAEKPINLMATSAAFMELAKIYAKQGRFDLAGLLSYRAMERFVEIGLQEFAPEFKMDKPDWTKLPMDESQFRMEYAKLWPKRNDPLPQKVGLIDGFAILSILDKTLGDRFCKKKGKNAVNIMMGLANIRNRSYLAHGVRNLNKAYSRKLRLGAEDLARAVLKKKEKQDEFKLLRDQLRPIELHQLWDAE